MTLKEIRPSLASVVLSTILLLSAASSAAVVTYQRSRMDTLAPGYSMTVGGTAVNVYQNDDVKYTRFAMSGASAVSITANAGWGKVTIVPSRYNVKPTVNGNVLTFTLSENKKLAIRSGRPEFFVFSDPLEENPPQLTDANVKNVMDFGPDSTGATTETVKLQSAIDWCSTNAATKPILFFPNGVYKTGLLQMKSNVRLYLQGGACLKGTGAQADYPTVGINTCGGACRFMILARDANHWQIYGRGVIDPQGMLYQKGGNHDLNTLRAVGCQRFIIDGITIRNSDNWNVCLWKSDSGKVNNLKMMTGFGSNTDGVNIVMSHNDTVTNCFHYGTDDAFNIGVDETWPEGAYNIFEQGNIVNAKWGSGLRISIVLGGPVHDVTFKDCEIIRLSGGAFYASAGSWMNLPTFGEVYNVRWENCWVDYYHDQGWPLSITGDDVESPPGPRHDMDVVNCGWDSRFGEGGWINGNSSSIQTYNIRFKNLKVGSTYCRSAADANLTIGNFTHDITFTVDTASTSVREVPATHRKPSLATSRYTFYGIDGRRVAVSSRQGSFMSGVLLRVDRRGAAKFLPVPR